MAEYIEREAVMKIIDDYGCTHGGTLGSHSGAVDVIGSAIYKLPVVETAEQKWTEVTAMIDKYSQAVANAMKGKCIPHKRETKAILNEMLDVITIKHGHIVWKEYYKGGIRRRKCLQEIKSAYIEQQMPCKQIAIIDERYLSKDPYCSECGKLLGEFLNYCGNCGAKMDGGDGHGT